MAQVSFVLLNDYNFTESEIDTLVPGNGTHTLWTSATQSNNTGLESMRIVIDYKEVLPAWPPASSVSYALALVIEALHNSDEWFPVAYQFEPFNYVENSRQREIYVDPSISDFNAGIDDIMYLGGKTIARISRQQGRVGLSWRARLICVENNHGSGEALQSAKISIYGEIY
jgi:hypothetical protein